MNNTIVLNEAGNDFTVLGHDKPTSSRFPDDAGWRTVRFQWVATGIEGRCKAFGTEAEALSFAIEVEKLTGVALRVERAQLPEWVRL